MNLKRSRRYRRGYPVAILVGFEDDYAVLWNVFSRVVKQSLKLKLEGKRTDEKVLYNFHQSVVEALKHLIKEGIKSIIVTAPQKTTYTSDFITHVQKHHRYLLNNKSPNRTNFAELEGSANNFVAVAELIKSKKFTDLLFKTTSEEADHIVGILEKCLYANKKYDSIMYTLKEIENTVIAKKKNDEMGTEYLLLTDKYLSENMSKNRIHRLMQIANNKNIKTRIIDIESSAGSRISQFGGIVFFSTSSSN
jgi:stalled ribosome rescue protein Dom34